MRNIKTIKEIKEQGNNNESMIKKGVYLTDEGSYEWLTSYRSGICKKLSTAMKKAGFENE